MRNPTTRRARPSSNSTREIVQLPWSYYLVLAICGCILAAGFFLAARQHFASMELGMRNSKLRRQLEDLESENRRLLLAREISLSPAEITRTARSLGFLEVNAPAALPIPAPGKTVKTPQLKAVVEKASAIQATPASLTMTAYQRPVRVEPAVLPLKRTTSAKQTKKVEAVKQRPIKPELTALAKR